MSDKREILDLFAQEIEKTIDTLTRSAQEAHALATHAESKAEDKYDTRGLEASYLAGAQSKRAMELHQTLQMYRSMEIKTFKEDDPIHATALVELRSETGDSSFSLLMPLGGGMSVFWRGKKVQTITPQSPLGQAILGRKKGDEISLLVGDKEREYEILQVE